jgi:glycosyltransferase involved in cell wall biosynthesis
VTDAPRPPLRVAVTVEQLWQPVPGGSGTYVRDLVTALAARGDVALTGLRARHADAPPGAWRLPDGVPVVASRLPRTAMYEAWARVRHARPPGGAAVDVVHATTWAVPPARGAALVVTVHDLAFRRSPEHFTPRGNSFFTRALDVVRREATVIAVSGTTRDDCVAAGIPADRVHVVPHGVTHVPVTADDVASFRGRHGIERPYVLWCGTLEPRKNLPGLLRAFARVAAADDELDLVLAGPVGWGGASDQVTALAAALPAGRVHRVGELTTTDLHAAYAGARAFCFPSLWEGFGMPVLEAMAHGVPVVTSSTTSTAEVAGDAALLVDPADDDALARAVLAAAGPEHDRLAALSVERATGFTWERCAERTVAVYRAAAGR